MQKQLRQRIDEVVCSPGGMDTSNALVERGGEQNVGKYQG